MMREAREGKRETVGVCGRYGTGKCVDDMGLGLGLGLGLRDG